MTVIFYLPYFITVCSIDCYFVWLKHFFSFLIWYLSSERNICKYIRTYIRTHEFMKCSTVNRCCPKKCCYHRCIVVLRQLMPGINTCKDLILVYLNVNAVLQLICCWNIVFPLNMATRCKGTFVIWHFIYKYQNSNIHANF